MRIEDESTQPSHVSYKEYKKKIVKNKKQSLMMFISIFFVLLLIFLGFAKLMSPDVDIAIGEDNVNAESAEDTFYGKSGNVDERLKALQDEDDGNGSVSNDSKTEEDGLVKIPEKSSKSTAEESKIEQEIDVIDEPVKKQPTATTTPTPVQKPQATATTSATARVVVGFYNTQAQADVARGILQDAGLGVTPHIRPMGAGYTLQVGAYSSKESANNLANKLLMNNYPARVVVDGN